MARFALLSLTTLALMGGCHKQEAPAPQAQQQAAPTPEPAAPALAVVTDDKGKALPAAEIKTLDGTAVKLADLKGKPLLVNLWATWCVPCVKELPTLDALAAQQAGKLQVVAVSQDLEGARVVAPFVAKRGFKTLKPYLDTSNALMLALKEEGLPVTILYGADGKEVWRLRGDLDWTGAKAKELLAQAGV
ncbi:TlpA family protein disulfide reductase [Sphingomonas nostoxanthinifaciens]|uniref:TlpA family protein disulfide reductase n=1 Tax=Sphingomonas nostoxanthinifaciens TaxID=2872652 RepID=UPI001CC1F4B6|nr:TlpA disulfide reductase family protein [Sphingomonas nostoxanthinifaciens]UAK23589.1 TlpA family protein disulfide reductase [Sphingomonas nostoxanthinifaciens]